MTWQKLFTRKNRSSRSASTIARVLNIDTHESLMLCKTHRVGLASLETRVEVWENEKCCGNTSLGRVFQQPFRVLQLPRVSLELDRNTENMFYISFRRQRDEKTEKQLVNFEYIKM